MKKHCLFILALLLIFFSMGFVAIAADPPADEKKHTEAGKYVTSLDAYEMWKSTPDKIKILDCRTPEEYVFVGHATMAYNIPSKLWTGKWNDEK